MHYTHLTPRQVDRNRSIGIVDATLQIFSVKLAAIKRGLEWPLSVYGVVAARDAVDHNRNLLFCRARRGSQKIKQDVRVASFFALPFPFLIVDDACLPRPSLLLILYKLVNEMFDGACRILF
jgi:hypothetical protein